MKLQTAYELTETIKDGRKLTLQMDWHHLTVSEVKLVKRMLRKAVRTLLGEQKLLFAEIGSNFGWVRCHSRIPWRPLKNWRVELKGFVRTGEPVWTQRKRVKSLVRKEVEETTDTAPFYNDPHYRSEYERTLAMAKKALCEEGKDYTLQGLPEEAGFRFEQTRYADGSYRIESSIAISGYAIGYALEELTEAYKHELQILRKKTPLFAGYIVYEMIPQSVHSYLYLCPNKVQGKRTEASGLEGYEWAAFINKELAEKLPEAQLAQLQDFADVSFDEDGVFYQNRCPVQAYGIQQKRLCRDAIYPILQPGYGYHEIALIGKLQMETVHENVYLLQKCGVPVDDSHLPYMMGFFCKTTPEESITSRFYDIAETITTPK